MIWVRFSFYDEYRGLVLLNFGLIASLVMCKAIITSVTKVIINWCRWNCNIFTPRRYHWSSEQSSWYFARCLNWSHCSLRYFGVFLWQILCGSSISYTELSTRSLTTSEYTAFPSKIKKHKSNNDSFVSYMHHKDIHPFLISFISPIFFSDSNNLTTTFFYSIYGNIKTFKLSNVEPIFLFLKLE